MAGNQDDAWLRQARLVDALVREEGRRMGLPINPKSFDELVASGELKAAECRVLSMDMVTPGWSDRSPSGRKETP